MKKVIFTFLAGILISLNISAQSYYTEEGKAVFKSRVTLHNFTGTSENLVGMIKMEDMSVDFYLDLETLDTGNGKRNKDMKLTLETEKHPFGEFFGKITTDFDPELTTEQDVIVMGNFTIHGITQEVEINGSLTVTDDGLLVKAAWILNLEDYEIRPPKLLFIKVDEKQEIEIEALLKPTDG